MAAGNEGGAGEGLKVVRLLLDAEQRDTLYRDLYILRARRFFSPVMNEDEYFRLKKVKEELDRSVRLSRTAIDQGDWEKARELAALIGGLRRRVEERGVAWGMGTRIYEPASLILDPFSAGLAGFSAAAGNRDQLRNGLISALSRLLDHDPDWSGLYRERHDFFALLDVAVPEASQATGQRKSANFHEDVLRAVEQGDVAQLDSLLVSVRQQQTVTEGSPLPRPARNCRDAGLDEPFPEETLSRAGAMGLAPVHLDAAEEFSDYLTRWAWQPTFHGGGVTREGGMQLMDLPVLKEYPEDVASRFRELLQLFMLHPFAASSGARYLPCLSAETLLVEDFPETDETAANDAVPRMLELPRRRALSREKIEQSLYRHGPRIVEELRLDPRHYRLVCIPFDTYCRLGREKQWGRQEYWTHFDGYQLLESGGIRALVGGDARFGGIFDLCSISHTDEREGVIARFAVVRRRRLSSGY